LIFFSPFLPILLIVKAVREKKKSKDYHSLLSMEDRDRRLVMCTKKIILKLMFSALKW
jgi:hypothetical protein